VYFCALEALRSAVGHADAACASVRLSARDGELRFEVAGDGGSGADLQAMADRIAALGGKIRIDPVPARGTRISGSVPATAIGLPAHPCGGPANWPMASLVASPFRRMALR
jgi:signal transduction histidine kinase